MVQNSGRYNFEKCGIRVNDKIDVNFMKIMLKDYSDLMICDLLEFGFPLGFEGNVETLHSTDKIWKCRNHKGATDFPHIYRGE